ncbi:MAG TPA: rhodanese-like domain-containing protein [Chloroflexota bacterium]
MARKGEDRGILVIGRGTGRPGLVGALALLALLVVLAVGCGAPSGTAAPAASAGGAVQTRQVAVDGGSYTNVDAAGLAMMLKTKDFPLINVHIPYEGEIEGTDQFLPYDTIESNLSKLPADKSAKIFLYCRSGNMSDQAARVLVKRGYKNVWNLDGGMIAWTKAGFKTVEKSH